MNENIKNEKKYQRKHREIYLVLLLLLAISVGFSYLTTQLDIIGNTTVQKQSWNVHFGTPVVDQTAIITGTSDRLVKDRGTAAIRSNSNDLIVDFTASLQYPGDYFEFTVPVINAGTIDAMISRDSGVTKTISPELNYITYTVNYVTTVPFQPEGGDGLLHGKNVTVKVRVEYSRDVVTNDNVNNMASGGVNLSSTFSMKFIQADNTASNLSFAVNNS